MESRRDPDELLKNLTEAEENGFCIKKGRLKIFFGYAAGVGKTYSMLDTAREEKASGADVVAGYIEPHARPDTLALLDGLELLSPKYIEHKGIQLKEFDLDAAIIRKPGIILVDELAHTNGEGCRHKKRWQDVKELLDAGINVYTTMNVQHLESLRDIVAAITHVGVGERVPDKIFDQADKIELVDIEPEELLKRLSAGKIYKKSQAAQAARSFFTRENLTALREIALRKTADQVNKTVMRERNGKGREYYTGEHVLICLSPSPSNEKVIRTAARMAYAFNARLTAVLVEQPQKSKEEEAINMAMEGNISLARQFGAQVEVLYGQDIPLLVGEYAVKNGVSKIVIGRTVKKSGILQILFGKKSLIDRLIQCVPGMDIYVIPDIRAKVQKAQAPRLFFSDRDRREMAVELLMAGAVLLTATVLGVGIEVCRLGETNQIMVYILAVILISGFSNHRMTGIAASAISVLLFNFFFTVPKYSLRAAASIYPFTFLTMLICALMVSSLSGRQKRQVRLLKDQSEKMQILITISNRLKNAADEEEILNICAKQVKNLLEYNVIIYKEENGGLTGKRIYQVLGKEKGMESGLDSKSEEAVAVWVCKNCHKAGFGTDTLPKALGFYLPIQWEGIVYGVLGIELKGGFPVAPNDKNVLYVILNETASALRAYRR